MIGFSHLNLESSSLWGCDFFYGSYFGDLIGQRSAINKMVRSVFFYITVAPSQVCVHFTLSL